MLIKKSRATNSARNHFDQPIAQLGALDSVGITCHMNDKPAINVENMTFQGTKVSDWRRTGKRKKPYRLMA